MTGLSLRRVPWIYEFQAGLILCPICGDRPGRPQDRLNFIISQWESLGIRTGFKRVNRADRVDSAALIDDFKYFKLINS